MNENLMQLTNQTNSIVNKLIECDSEDPPKELIEELDSTDIKMKDKVDGYYFITERLKLETEFWKHKAEEYLKVSKVCKSLREHLQNNLKSAMKKLDQVDLFGNDIRYKLSNSKPKLNIFDEGQLPSSYLTEVIEYKPDKERIINDLKDGKKVPGCELIACHSIRHYVNKKN